MPKDAILFGPDALMVLHFLVFFRGLNKLDVLPCSDTNKSHALFAHDLLFLDITCPKSKILPNNG